MARARTGGPRSHPSRPNFINLSGCSNVLIQDVTLQNPPTFHLMLKGNNINLTIQGITINTPCQFPQHRRDGSGFHQCVDSELFDQCGDDNIEIGGSGAAADITVSNCTFGTGHGVSIGSITSGGVHDLMVSNCTFNGTRLWHSHEVGPRPGRRGAESPVSGHHDDQREVSRSSFTATITRSERRSGINASPLMASTDAVQTVTGNDSDLAQHHHQQCDGDGDQRKSIAGIIWGLPEMVVSNVTLCQGQYLRRPRRPSSIYNAQGIQIIDSQLGGPNSANTLTLYNAQITVTNSRAQHQSGDAWAGWRRRPTNKSLAFFNAAAAITDTNMLGTAPSRWAAARLRFSQASVSSRTRSSASSPAARWPSPAATTRSAARSADPAR